MATYRVLELGGAEQAFRTVTRELTEPGPGQVRIRLAAAGFNRRDYWIWAGKYAGLRWPAVLGSDGCGHVEAVGEGVDRAWLGRRVVANPSLEWGAREDAPGPAWRILGVPDEGTFAECLTLAAEQVHEAPAHLSDFEAAALPLAALTSWRALFRRGGLQAGEKVLLTGIGGGTGQWLLAMALAAGAQVWVTSSRPERIAQAQKSGAAGGVDYRAPDWTQQLAEQCPEGFDLAVDSAGGADFAKLPERVRPGGRLVFFGATRGPVPEFNLRSVFWRHIDLRGTTMGSPRDFAAMLDWVGARGLRPKLEGVLGLGDAAEGMRRLAGGEPFGKLVIQVTF